MRAPRLAVALVVLGSSLFIGPPASAGAGGTTCPLGYKLYNIPGRTSLDAADYAAQRLPKGQYAMLADLYAVPNPPRDPAVVLCGKPTHASKLALIATLIILSIVTGAAGFALGYTRRVAASTRAFESSS